jgi:hypothetical protein
MSVIYHTFQHEISFFSFLRTISRHICRSICNFYALTLSYFDFLVSYDAIFYVMFKWRTHIRVDLLQLD